MSYRIKWMSGSTWQGSTLVTHDGDEEYATREEAVAAMAEMMKDDDLMKDVFDAAIEAQSVEGWLEIAESKP